MINANQRIRNQRGRPQRSHVRRKGSLVVLATASFFTMASLSGLCINISYMELVRSEQRLATDAAAKAALVSLGQTQSISSAKQSAKSIAVLHRVAGSPVVLADSDIQIGTSVGANNGTYAFTASNVTSPTTVTNSVRIQSSLGNGVRLIMLPQLMGQSTFTSQQSATSTRIDNDVCIVVDRSGSMAWDLSSTPFTYPGSLNGKSAIQNYFQLPDPNLSRWASLTRAVGTFVSVLNENPIRTRVAMASYASNFTFGIWTTTVASQDQTLTTDYTTLTTQLNRIASQPLIGNTNIAAGLREGINLLTDPSNSRITSCKTIILLTDGVMTQGDDPVALATTAREMNIRIHTIAFSAQADVSLMQRVATAGGGQCYVAPTDASLQDTFRKIAASLPNMLTN